ncbi:transposase [Candidatus Poriferisodalis sp.]|uniref:transposase n=1 Tax=Candidatus Poriferisodalis sp. TaxID=3101277 RepID=UPI003B020541
MLSRRRARVAATVSLSIGSQDKNPASARSASAASGARQRARHRVSTAKPAFPRCDLMLRRSRYREQHWGAALMDARRGRLADMVPGRSACGAGRWLGARPARRQKRIRWAVTGPVGAVSQDRRRSAPPSDQVADSFHAVKLANSAIDGVRRRAQQPHPTKTRRLRSLSGGHTAPPTCITPVNLGSEEAGGG